MKKIIFWILSFLLISPVFADNYDLVHNVFVSFENVNNSDNITYWLYYNFSRSTSTFYNVSPFYFSSSSVPSYDISFFPSESSINGSSYSDSNWFNAFSIASNSSIIGRSDWSSYWSLFSIWKNWDSYNPSIFNYYYQASSSSSWVPNVTLNFWNYVSWGNWDLISDNSFLRFFYNSDSFFTSWYFPSINNSVPFDFQYFTLYSPYVKTIKGQAWLWFNFDRISPSIWNWFSFINFSSVYSDLRFFSVFPNWDYTWGNESTFDITSFSDKFYMFRLDSNKYHSDINNIWVISKCDSILCSWLSLDTFYSSLVYSEYICSISSLINIKNDCVLVYWGILSGVLWNLSSADSSINLQSNDFIKYFLSSISDFNNFWNSVSVYFSSDVIWNSLSVSTNSVTVDWSRHSAWYFTYSFPVTLLSFTPDILLTIPFNQWSQWGYFPTPAEVSDLQLLYCNQNPSSPYCNWIYTWSWDNVRCWLNSSWFVNCYFTDYTRPTSSSDCPYIESWLDNWQVYIQYRSTWENRCVQWVSASVSNSSPEIDISSELTWLENNINLAFSGIVWENFKFYSCPFNSPLKAFHLSSIGWLSSFLLDKFFDVNLVWPFNCLLWWILYSETDSVSLWSRLLSDSYHWEKFLNNFPDDVKKTINWLLFAGMVLFFWSFRPKDH